MDIAGSTTAITGGASGLGLATAEHLSAAGGNVALLDLPRSAGAERAAALGPNAIFLPCDVTSAEQVDEALTSAAARFGGITGLVNCAGIGPAARTLGRRGPADLAGFTRVIEVNLIGTFNSIRLAAVHMAKNVAAADGERGVIVNTASVAAFEGQIGQAAYSATKAAVAGMTLPIARELARFGIRCVSIAPGIFHTPMMDGMPKEVQDSLAAQVPFPARLGKPEEFAQLVASVFEIPMLNGTTIRLDGAVRMQPR